MVGYIPRSGAEQNGTKIAELLSYKPCTFRSVTRILNCFVRQEDDCLDFCELR